MKLKVLRDFNFHDRKCGNAVAGAVIERDEKTALYLLAHNKQKPMVEVLEGGPA